MSRLPCGSAARHATSARATCSRPAGGSASAGWASRRTSASRRGRGRCRRLVGQHVLEQRAAPVGELVVGAVDEGGRRAVPVEGRAADHPPTEELVRLAVDVRIHPAADLLEARDAAERPPVDVGLDLGERRAADRAPQREDSAAPARAPKPDLVRLRERPSARVKVNRPLPVLRTVQSDGDAGLPPTLRRRTRRPRGRCGRARGGGSCRGRWPGR